MRWTLGKGLPWMLVGLMSSPPGWGEPAQRPLLSQEGEAPRPNVMLTLDDSSSMNWDFLPDGGFSRNGVPGLWLGQDGSTVAFPLAGMGTQGRGLVPAQRREPATLESIYQKQYRSPDVNALFYNPDIRYRPWVAGQGARWPDMPALAARLDPFFGETFDLTRVQSRLAARFCSGWDPSSGQGVCRVEEQDFHPGLYYRLKDGGDPRDPVAYQRFDVNVSGEHAPLSKHPARTDCAGPRCAQWEERRNFANWFTYHRQRVSMAKAALSETLVTATGRIRLGWGTINQPETSIDDFQTAVVHQGIRELDAVHLNQVLQNLQAVQPQGGTPLREAVQHVGRYFRARMDRWSPWQNRLGEATSGQASCRRAFHVVVTDGLYNDPDPPIGDLDGHDGPDHADANPLGVLPTRIVSAPPRRDGLAGQPGRAATLADTAMQDYWADLMPSLSNRVPPTLDDPAFWQHLSLLAVGLGLQGELPSATEAERASTLAQLQAGTLAWPDPHLSEAARVDDLWHAALNTGGAFYAVHQARDLEAALQAALTQTHGGRTQSGGVVLAGVSLSANGQVKYVTRYRWPAAWGDVQAYAVDASGEITSPGRAWLWSAAERLPLASARSLATWNGRAGVSFTWSQIGSDNQARLGSSDVLAYLRGDLAQDKPERPFRSREGHVLGAFVHSPPTVVQAGRSWGYERLSNAQEAGSYAAYRAARQSRRDGVVWAGSSAGVLSAFRLSDGREVFGYLPQAGLVRQAKAAMKVSEGASQPLVLGVDGPLLETDAYITPRGEATPRWVNLLLGSLGAGGRGLFALAMPTPNPTALTPSAVQWELAGDADLGFVTASFQVGRLVGQGWYAFVGNGVDSPSGDAVLLVLDLQTGRIVQRLRIPSSGPTGATGANGLMGVQLLRNAHEEVYAAYAGDLQGNVWRFDFPDANPSHWGVAWGGQPLLRARDTSGQPQPLTAAPLVLTHPDGGSWVGVGTGQLLHETDVHTSGIQSFYGVRDPTPLETSAFAAAPVTRDRAQLLTQQLISTPIQGADGQRYLSATTHALDVSRHAGWVLDLTARAGQRVVTAAQSAAGQVIFSSVVPPAPAGECDVSMAEAHHFVLDAWSGAAAPKPIFDVNADGVINAQDAVHLPEGHGIAAVRSTDAVVGMLLGSQEGVVQSPSTSSHTAATEAVCRPDPLSKCPPHHCLVALTRADAGHIELCLPDRCARSPDAEGCRDKVILDRIWRPLLNPPVF